MTETVCQIQEWEPVEACPGCESRRLTCPLGGDLARCEACGLFFRAPRPTQAEIARSYATQNTYEAWSREIPDRDRMWAGRLRWVRRQVAGGALLDIGTGDAHFLDLARRYYEVVGTDFSPAAAQRALRRGYEIRVGQIESLDFGARRFDVVTLWHVLEHLPHPLQALRAIHRLLQPRGVLVVAVPNEENAFVKNRFLGKANYLIHPPVFGDEIHLIHFQPRTLRAMLTRGGFEVVRFGVDDTYLRKNLKNRLILAGQKALCALTGWHCGIAQFAVAVKRDETTG